jgi:hypothetical protein
MQSRVALDSPSSCLSLLKAGITECITTLGPIPLFWISNYFQRCAHDEVTAEMFARIIEEINFFSLGLIKS